MRISRSFATLVRRHVGRREVARVGRRDLHGEVARRARRRRPRGHQRADAGAVARRCRAARRRLDELEAAHADVLADLGDQRAAPLVDRLAGGELRGRATRRRRPAARPAPPWRLRRRSPGSRRSRATKSVSQFTSTSTAVLPSADSRRRPRLRRRRATPSCRPWPGPACA